MFIQSLRTSILAFLVFTLLLGGLYPAAVTVVAQAVFPHQANGSLIHDEKGTVVGSELIGQNFSAPKYFWGRLSATTPIYNAASSSGSNQGVNSADLKKATQARIDDLRAADPDNHKPIPVDLVTASASGLDPHISIAAARYQMGRVAKARGLQESEVKKLVDANTQGLQGQLLGEPRVNVLKLNLSLDKKTQGK